MRRMLKGRRPSPAMVLAVIALVVALAGTSMASIATISKISGKTVKKNTLPGNRVKKNTVTGKQVKESSLGEVPKAQDAVSAKSANNATTANGPFGSAHVNSGGTLLAGRNVSQANLVNGAANFYCFSGLSFPVNGAQVTVDYWNGSPHFSTGAQVGFAARGGLVGTGCPASTQVFVHTLDEQNDTPEPGAFFITFYN